MVTITEKNTVKIANLTKDKTAYVDITGSDTIIIYAEITSAKNFSNVTITTVDYGAVKPSRITKEPEIEDIKEEFSNKTIENISIYRYVDIALTTNEMYAEDSDIKSARIIFIVRQDWLEDNNIDANSITLLRFKNNNWEKIYTKNIGSDEEDGLLIFRSKLPGFSTFAVVGSKVVENKPKPDEEPELPWIIIIGFIIAAIALLIFILFKAKLIYIEDAEIPEKE